MGVLESAFKSMSIAMLMLIEVWGLYCIFTDIEFPVVIIYLTLILGIAIVSFELKEIKEQIATLNFLKFKEETK
jgi:hypothetical protein